MFLLWVAATPIANFLHLKMQSCKQNILWLFAGKATNLAKSIARLSGFCQKLLDRPISGLFLSFLGCLHTIQLRRCRRQTFKFLINLFCCVPHSRSADFFLQLNHPPAHFSIGGRRKKKVKWFHLANIYPDPKREVPQPLINAQVCKTFNRLLCGK